MSSRVSSVLQHTLAKLGSRLGPDKAPNAYQPALRDLRISATAAMRRAGTVAAVLLVAQHCTALLAPHVATRTHLRAVRIDGLLDEEVISKRTNTHRCLKELRKKGGIVDALAADAVVKSQFGDPLATDAEDAIKINKVLARRSPK